MKLFHRDGQRDRGGPVKDGIFCTPQGEVNANFTSAFWTLDLQNATAFAELVCDDPLAVIAVDSDLDGFSSGHGGGHIRLL